jgi:hypothetical protein
VTTPTQFWVLQPVESEECVFHGNSAQTGRLSPSKRSRPRFA